MYFELYMDTLFLLNFVMNLYLLMMVNITVRRTATRLRLIGGALTGAFIYCLGAVLPHVPPWLKLTAGTAFAGALMIKLTFHPVSLKAYMKLLEILMGYSFLMGGVLLFLMRYIKGLAEKTVGAAGILGIGGLIYLAVTYIAERRRKEKKEFCKVTLIQGEQKVTVEALIDTGNGLTEPVSGKPVSVVDQNVLKGLWPEGLPELYRAVPYHSVGCEHGILKGYLISEAVLETGGLQSRVQQIYLGAGENNISVAGGYGMILNPRLLESGKLP